MFLEGTNIGIDWCIYKLNKDSDELYSALKDHIDQERFKLIKTEKRKQEFLGARWALYHLFGHPVKIEYDTNGKPHIVNSPWNISITHSGNYIAVARSKQVLGIDIEHISEKLERTKHKYCSTQELSQIDASQNLKHLCLHWSGKESAYKAIGNYPFIFDKEFKIESFTPQNHGQFMLEIDCQIHQEQLTVDYQTIDDYVFTMCSLKA